MNCAGDSRAHLYFDSIIQAVSQLVSWSGNTMGHDTKHWNTDRKLALANY